MLRRPAEMLHDIKAIIMHESRYNSLRGDTAPWYGSLLKFFLVAGVHTAIVMSFLEVADVIKQAPRPLPLSLIQVLVLAPVPPFAGTRQAISTPVRQQAAIIMPKPVTTPARTIAAITQAPSQVVQLVMAQQPGYEPVAARAAALAPAGLNQMPTNAVPVTQAHSEPGFDAAYLNNPAPAYPLISRRQGESGKVLLRVKVSSLGTAATVEITQSCGFPRLDQAALDAVRKWRFVPARRGDEAISASVMVPLTFKLDT